MEENKDYELENNIDNEEIEDDEISADDLLNHLISEINRVEIDFSEVSNCKIDKKAFKDGVKEASKMCGMICAFLNLGMSKKDASELALNQLACNIQVDLLKTEGKENKPPFPIEYDL